jgi:5-methylcytosine-specific restriction protein A
VARRRAHQNGIDTHSLERPCALCGRAFHPAHLTRHHCVPRQKGGTREHVEMICRQCHGMVHATYTNQTLAALYADISQLRRAPELQGYLKWVRKQPVTRHKRNVSRRRKI